MTAIWIVLGLVAWMLGFLFVLALMRMAGDEDRAALQQERLLEPSTDAMVRRVGIARLVVVERAWRDLDAAGTRVACRLEWRDAA
jgi:hypothetical protein